ncbi:MAG: hypothetical protein J3R72DRAFT_452371 [Linnemannia gamsii]|nr:MAG: hypothetical protein J3R72DRAFT_452371 [Linnemannia gamsii]
MLSLQFFTHLLPFLLFLSFADAFNTIMRFTLTRWDNGFTVEGSCWYKDEFSGISKHENFEDRSASNFFNNANADIGWYIDLPSANVKVTHNAHTFDVLCTSKVLNTYSTFYDCHTAV